MSGESTLKAELEHFMTQFAQDSDGKNLQATKKKSKINQRHKSKSKIINFGKI